MYVFHGGMVYLHTRDGGKGFGHWDIWALGHWGTGERLHSFLADTLILFQSGRAYYPHPIELSPLRFGKFHRACILTDTSTYNSLVFAKKP